ncbi:DUF6422 family protein [Streptomyces genisteinicus]|uniref:Uncharacterized protein n=1 Tax=Streptomyces genisteinicus TaxID=2768068 RepID=A0A7H0HXV2_9ACTN|nr:DUF6422 family protein [Streptomyces genisteinicus]QNP65368.1 hypothetical protein IAG43_22185 [Streptomyces genisteinicus]
MSYPPDGLTDEQRRALAEAARLVGRARTEAAGLLTRVGLDPDAAPLGALEFCTEVVSQGPPQRTCGCPAFRGDSDFCFSRYLDYKADTGDGPVVRTCGHPLKSHESL